MTIIADTPGNRCRSISGICCYVQRFEPNISNQVIFADESNLTFESRLGHGSYSNFKFNGSTGALAHRRRAGTIEFYMFRRNSKPPAIPAGVRVYAIGDIHGRLDLLEQLLGMIGEAEEAWPAERAILIFLGDYVDRGPDSCGVIELLMGGLPEGFEHVFLRGNHEEMMLKSLQSSEAFESWALNGGIATARSYGLTIAENTPVRALNGSVICREFAEAVPQSHKDFIRSLPVKVEAGDYLFVHAGVRPGVPLEAQSDLDCLYIRDEFLTYTGDFGKVVVHGHTPVPEPESLRNRIGIDTRAFHTGRLTAVCLEERSRRFMTTLNDK
jgi:serine/threonine protein phosphatase 1